MIRADIINIIGREYLTSNIENNEYSYPKASKELGIKLIVSEEEENYLVDKKSRATPQFLDLRFCNHNISILVETKRDFSKNLEAAKEQLSAYVKYEKALTGNNIIAILANTQNDDIMVWNGSITDENYLSKEYRLKTFEEYAEYFVIKINDKEKIMRNTYKLNEILHGLGIKERLRSQFVGTCLLTLKNSKADLTEINVTTDMIRAEMKRVLGELLQSDINKASKITLLYNNVLNSQDIRTLEDNSFRKILIFIKENILPFINDKSTTGQDLLNLFFVTFNKYVGKEDKNQAFTPDHITDFMADIVEVNRYSKVLDPCCGSGSFLVRALTHALDDCANKEEQINVKKNNIFGIELDENIYGLATTNMLIHGDGNSNIMQGSCFDLEDEIKKWNIDTILMNPPYNATRKSMPKEYADTWTAKAKQDPSKGLYFVKRIIDIVKKGKMAVLLPMAAAIGSSTEIKRIKSEILRENTLEAVFSLPDEIFYPGASSVACCMIFNLGKRHDSSNPTFFGYYKNDGFQKKKNLGRIEMVNIDGTGVWNSIKKEWIELYRKKMEVPGKSTLACVTGNNEWLAEAYMETDYYSLEESYFEKMIRDYYAYLIKREV